MPIPIDRDLERNIYISHLDIYNTRRFLYLAVLSRINYNVEISRVNSAVPGRGARVVLIRRRSNSWRGMYGEHRRKGRRRKGGGDERRAGVRQAGILCAITSGYT